MVPWSTLTFEYQKMANRLVLQVLEQSDLGICSKVFEHPFDLTKVRLQSQVLDATARFNGPIDCLLQTWRKEGIRGLYRVSFTLFATSLYPLCGRVCRGVMA